MVKKEDLVETLKQNGYAKVIDVVLESVILLGNVFDLKELVEIYATLLDKYLDKYPEVLFSSEMIEDEQKEINYNDGENTNTRSQGVRIKTDLVIGGTKKLVEHKKTGVKRSNERDPLLEENYKKRAAVRASHLREHAVWSISAVRVEAAIKANITEYTKKYNETFGTSFSVYYAKPRKDWEAWYLNQTLKTL